MFNKVVLVGNLTRDIEMRYAQSGTAIGSTGIAVTRRSTVNGEKREETCFVDITFWGRTAEVANQYLSKGSKVLVEGRLKYEQWQDSNGQNRSKHTISVENMEMLGANPNAQGGGYGGSGYGGGSQGYQGGANNGGGYNQSGYQGSGANAANKMSGDPYAETTPKTPQKPAQQAQQQEKLKEIDVDNFEADDTELPF